MGVLSLEMFVNVLCVMSTETNSYCQRFVPEVDEMTLTRLWSLFRRLWRLTLRLRSALLHFCHIFYDNFKGQVFIGEVGDYFGTIALALAHDHLQATIYNIMMYILARLKSNDIFCPICRPKKK